ncbi:serine/threonine-protein phosphatase 7 long form homolog [Benincasa hispida]|uniref:serine/threonine-protein phosphatase 7 long form homolog n=1 Tax=Benincasa hispida TaxID=102211 RepID=UPI001900D7AF|nr:serine/threonine-protein phosphatase 7 long form homolog [Benincasa hispida]
MAELETANPNYLRYFASIDPKQWTQSHDGGHRYGWLTMKVAESTNVVKKGARKLPITALVQATFYRTIAYFAARRVEIEAAFESRECFTRWNNNYSVTRAPTHVLVQHRHILDTHMPNQIIWEPYNHLIQLLPPYCLDGNEIWTSKCPLICFFVVKWHHLDRVMHQFGMLQQIPQPCNMEARLLSHDLRGKHERDWIAYLAPQITIWENRHCLVVNGPPINNGVGTEPGYIEWYSTVSRLYITKAEASYHLLAELPNLSISTQRVLRRLTSIYRVRYFDGDVPMEEQCDPARY